MSDLPAVVEDAPMTRRDRTRFRRLHLVIGLVEMVSVVMLGFTAWFVWVALAGLLFNVYLVLLDPMGRPDD